MPTLALKALGQNTPAYFVPDIIAPFPPPRHNQMTEASPHPRGFFYARIPAVKIPDSWAAASGVLGASWLGGIFLLRSKAAEREASLEKARIENEAKAAELALRDRELDIREKELDQRRASDDNQLADQMRKAMRDEIKSLSDKVTTQSDEIKSQSEKISAQSIEIAALTERVGQLTIASEHHKGGQHAAEMDAKRARAETERVRSDARKAIRESAEATRLALEARTAADKASAEKIAELEAEVKKLDIMLNATSRAVEVHEVAAHYSQKQDKERDSFP